MRPDGPRDPIVGPDDGPAAPFPIRLDGEVIRGFGRGSKELGIPTANLPIEGLAVGGHEDLDSGVYYGWASLSSYVSAADQSTSHSLPVVPGADTSNTSTATSTTSGSGGGGNDTNGHHAPSSSSAPDTPPSAGSLTRDGVFPMVMSVGWNPYYKNEKRSVEVHVMHAFAGDFYGARMKVLVLGFIRPEYDYTDLDSLVRDIRTDMDVGLRSLDRDGYRRWRDEEEAWLREF